MSTTIKASDFEVLEELGRGGYAAVHRAIDRRSGAECVVKILDSKSADPTHRAMFIAEYEALGAIHAAGPTTAVVQVLGFIESPVPTIVLEYLRGVQLGHYLESAPTLPEKIILMSKIAQALAVVHSRGFLYCDLTAANVMLRPDGTVTLIDFGLARPLGAAAPAATAPLRGTIEYMSPEQLGGGSLDVRSDLYALGALFYQILTGHPPFHDGTPEDIRLGHLMGNIPPVAEILPTTPALLSKITAILLQRRPYLRYSSASDVVRRLAAVHRGLTPLAAQALTPHC